MTAVAATTAERRRPTALQGDAAQIDEDLADCFGTALRRISHDAALVVYGCPLMPVPAVRSAAEPVAAGIDRWEWAIEPEQTLLVAARCWTGDTWLSDPGRALLELAQDGHPRSGRWEEYSLVALSYRPELFDAADIVGLAKQMGWDAGLRRLCSLVEWIDGLMRRGRRNTGRRLPPAARAIPELAPPPDPLAPWTDISAGFGPEDAELPSAIASEPSWDHRWKVRWHCDPRIVLRAYET